MKDMRPEDIAWLAGLMEGEAAIGAWAATNRKASMPSKNVKYARLEISSVDPDVIDRLHILTGIGNVHKHYSAVDRPNHKKSSTWRVAKAEEVLALLTLLENVWFSDRRRQQIAEAIKAAEACVERKRSGESTSRKNRRKQGS